MPLLRSDALPLSPEEVEGIRARLDRPYSFETVDREERRYLFIRIPEETPNPVVDLERGCDPVPTWIGRAVSDVFLLGTRNDLHMPGHYARQLFDARERFEDGLARRARAELDVQYGIKILQVPGDPANVERLLVRIPRDQCTDLAEADLVQIAARVMPLHHIGSLAHVRTCHVVAEADAFRFTTPELLADLSERWAPPPEPAPPTVLEPPREPPMPPPPRRVEDVTPVFEIEVHLDATPDTSGTMEESEAALVRALEDSGYEVRPGADRPFRLEAKRTVAFPNRVAALSYPELGPAQASDVLAQSRRDDVDLLLVLTNAATPEALRRLSATRAKVIYPAEAPHFRT